MLCAQMGGRDQSVADTLLGLAGLIFLAVYAVKFLYEFLAAIGPAWSIAIAVLLCAAGARWRWPAVPAVAGCAILTVIVLAGGPTAGGALLCSVCWMAGCLAARKALAASAKTHPFAYAVAGGAFEFAATFTAAALFACIAAAWPGRYPLARVLVWRDRLVAARSILKTISIGSGEALLLLAAIFVLERVRGNSRAAGWFTSVWHAWRSGSRWFKRAALALTALFCFSFTAVLPGGVVEGMARAIRETDQNYAALLWQVELDLRAQFKVQVYDAVWQQLSEAAKASLNSETSWNATAAGIPEVCFNPAHQGALLATAAEVKEAETRRRVARLGLAFRGLPAVR